MRIPMLLIAVVVGLVVAFAGYNYLNQPRTVGNRIDSTVGELKKGNFGEAVDEAGNATNGDKIKDDVKDATTPPAQ